MNLRDETKEESDEESVAVSSPVQFSESSPDTIEIEPLSSTFKKPLTTVEPIKSAKRKGGKHDDKINEVYDKNVASRMRLANKSN
ncbi:hypothetical protein FQA39_LY05094 [Lamprigera yunnana]|nr:hypothetical protein FQA39_LY05094 [Lamprigera yunnana]